VNENGKQTKETTGREASRTGQNDSGQSNQHRTALRSASRRVLQKNSDIRKIVQHQNQVREGEENGRNQKQRT
jgi:hypothetical protein